MKKFAIASLAAVVLASFGSALAQDTASHDLRVTIPEALMIRIVPVVTGARQTTVVFDYAAEANEAAYLAAIAAPGGTWVAPTGHTLAAIEVLAVGSPWRVTVGAGELTDTGIERDRIRVTSTNPAYAPFLLNSGTANVATGAATTWQSLGISGDSYALLVDGTEDAGEDTVLVTYSIFAN